MTKKISCILIACLYIFIASAETIKLNDKWLFQRLDKTVEKLAIENQGSAWESQYNVTHVATNAELRIPEDTLQAEFAQLKPDKWEVVTLPHTAKIEDLVVLHQWEGVCYYRKIIEAQTNWKGKKIWLEFEGAMQLADVWVNGKHITQHAGGYTPFVVDLSDILLFNQPNEILVRLDNQDNPLIPPGKPLNKLDFCYYSGLYRDVNLIVKSDTYISHSILADKVAGGGIFVSYPQVSENEAVINVKTHVVNDSRSPQKLIIRQQLFEIDGLFTQRKIGKEVLRLDDYLHIEKGKDIQYSQDLKVSLPKLWSPDSPSLYLLRTEILDNGKIIDIEENKIGIRHIEFSKEKGFYINGKPLRLVGSNRHMEYPYLGYAISDNAQYRDIYQIKESGFNIVRLGHYPQDPSVLDACDELGLLAIEPIPGWQFFNKNQLFTALTYRDVRDMIRRDRNHPSIILWETTLNESWPPTEWKDGAIKTAHEEYPGDQCYTAGDTYGYDGFDVSYNDWKEGFHRPNTTNNAGFIREYYDYEFGGHYSTTRIGRKDGEKALLQNAWNAQWSHNRYRAQYPSTAGDAVWSMYDYNRGCCDNVCESGVADLFRLPKFSLHFFYSQLDAGISLPSGKVKPNIFIANYWAQGDDNRNVIVFGNVDEVELKINGRRVAKQNSDNGIDANYISLADGGNCKNLAHAPFTFQNIKWEKGILEAIGYINGKVTTSQKVVTPEEPNSLQISYFESGKQASKNDVLIVYVAVKDKNDNLCIESNEQIKLQVDSDSSIIGPSEVNAIAGVASFIIKTGCKNTLNINAISAIGKADKIYQLRD